MPSKKELVMLYTAVPRLFRATYIGYVYEISQHYPFILLAEKLDPESEKALKNKKWFPHLEKIIHIDQYTGEKRGLFESHKYFSKLAKKIIDENKPDFVLGGSIVNSFEKYLFRYAKLSGATTIAIQAGFQTSSWENLKKRTFLLWRDTPINLKYPPFIRQLKLYPVLLQQHIKELIDYWIYPMMVGTYPFFHKSLFIFVDGVWVREFDYAVVFSQKEVNVELLSGRPKDKIMILEHPLLHKSRYIFEKAYHMPKIGPKRKKNKNITVMIDYNTAGHRRDNFKFISEKDYLQSRIEVINLISNVLTDYRIFIKPHPTTKNVNFTFLKNYFEKRTKNITVVDPLEPADKYITESSIIIGFPTPSTTLMTTMYQDQNKIILYLDLLHEFMGDEFRFYPPINTIETLEELENILLSIKYRRYKQKKVKSTLMGYPSATSILDKIIKSKNE